MIDDNERSVASAGSGSRLPLESFRQEWVEKARDMTFFAAPMERLSRDELLAVIGYLATQVEDERRMHRSTLKILKERHPVLG
jgi:hypothetical protein